MFSREGTFYFIFFSFTKITLTPLRTDYDVKAGGQMGGNYYSLRGRDNRDLHCHGKKHVDLRGESNNKK